MSSLLDFSLLMCILFASLFLALVAQKRLDAIVARRMFTIINLLAALLISFDADVAHVAKFVLVVIGPAIIGAVLSVAESALPPGGGGDTSVNRRSN